MPRKKKDKEKIETDNVSPAKVSMLKAIKVVKSNNGLTPSLKSKTF